MVASPQPSITPGMILGGRYRVGSVIARGGMGSVYGGLDERLGREVAIKVLLRELAQEREARARFEREAMLVARLGHPNVAQVLDFGHVADGSAYLVMERVPGETLSQVLSREGRVAPQRASEIVRQVLDALAAAHDAGVVHRDIKPGNVMVFRPGPDREVAKLLDFGVARMTETNAYTRLTGTGVVVGTPAYMAPEQARGEGVDVRTDIYAVGVLLYCLLAGRKPFSGDVVAMLEGVLYSDPPALAALAPEASLELVAVVTRAMRKDPANRFQRAAEMASALASLAPVPTGRISRVDRTALLESASMPPVAVPAVSVALRSSGPPEPVPSPAVADAAPVIAPPVAPTVSQGAATASPGGVSQQRGLLVAGALLVLFGGVGGALIVGLVVAGAWWWRGGAETLGGASGAPTQLANPGGGAPAPVSLSAPAAGRGGLGSNGTSVECQRAIACCEAVAQARLVGASACPNFALLSRDQCQSLTSQYAGMLTTMGHDASACGAPFAAPLVESVPAARDATLTPGTPLSIEVEPGGSVMGYSLAGHPCPGMFPSRPQLALSVPAHTQLDISVRASSDSTLAVRTASGRMACDDDGAGYPNPLVSLDVEDAVTLEIYVGLFTGSGGTATLVVTPR